MAEPLILPVPEMVDALYLVPVRRAIGDPVAAVRSALEAAPETIERGLALAMLDRSMLQVEEIPNEPSSLPIDLIRIFGAESRDVQALSLARTLLRVQTFGRPGYPPLHEFAARYVAIALAGLTESAVLDLAILRLQPAADAAEALPVDGQEIVMSRWIVVPQSAAERGYWLTTKGLGRFGLPELESVDVPPQLTGGWCAFQTATARALMLLFDAAIRDAADGASFVELPSEIELGVHAVDAAYGRPSGDEDVTVRVRLVPEPSPDPDADQFLALQPPIDYGSSAGEYYAEVCNLLFGRSDDEIRYVEPTDSMEQAMAAAVSCLDVARARFVAGEFMHHRLLMVKWRLIHDDGSEYPWAFVTDWTDPALLLGSSASDADCDPSVRVGRPVRLTRDSIVDWGVFVEGDGLVEGGWTNALLEGQPLPPIPAMPGGGPTPPGPPPPPLASPPPPQPMPPSSGAPEPPPRKGFFGRRR